jgi:hypothetical protein
MSEGGHHHGADMGGQQGVQPGMFPPPEPHHHHIADSSDPFALIPSTYQPPRTGAHRYRPRTGSAAWVGLWIVRLAVVAFVVFVIFEIVHGASSTPTP